MNKDFHQQEHVTKFLQAKISTCTVDQSSTTQMIFALFFCTESKYTFIIYHTVLPLDDACA